MQQIAVGILLARHISRGLVSLEMDLLHGILIISGFLLIA